jgi:hypothetical protein
MTQPKPPENKTPKISTRAAQFDQLPGSAALSLNDASTLADRSRPSLYRDIKAGRLKAFKIGFTTRVTAGELRRYLGGEVEL